MKSKAIPSGEQWMYASSVGDRIPARWGLGAPRRNARSVEPRRSGISGWTWNRLGPGTLSAIVLENPRRSRFFLCLKALVDEGLIHFILHGNLAWAFQTQTIRGTIYIPKLLFLRSFIALQTLRNKEYQWRYFTPPPTLMVLNVLVHYVIVLLCKSHAYAFCTMY